MATAAQVVKAALQRILVQDSEAPLIASEYQDAIFAMNNFMLDLDAQGTKLGYTEVTNLADVVTIPPGALRGLIANLAIDVSPDYDGTVSGALAQAAKDGLMAMRKLGRLNPTTSHPSTLPIGSGNEGYWHNGYWNNHFYPGDEAAILAETTGSISLESGTQALVP